jgi:hypothetical protein
MAEEVRTEPEADVKHPPVTAHQIGPTGKLPDYLSRGWFADYDRDSEGVPLYESKWPWVASVQMDGMTGTLGGHWFATEGDCLDFIRANVAGLGMWGD